jgi:hypothetical protein
MEQEGVVDDKTLDEELNESIAATLKDIQSREAPIDKVDDAVIAASEAVGKTNDKPRDPEGKFTKAPKESKQSTAPAEKPDKAPIAGAVEQVAVAPTEAVEAPQGIDISRAPSSWKPAAKAAWAALPEPVRAEIYRREGDFHNGAKGIKPDADFGKSIRGIVEPYRAFIEAEGGTPERAVADTMRTAALFRTGTQQQKLEAIFAIDKQFNGGLNQHFQQAVQAEVAKATGQPVQRVHQPQSFQDSRVDTLMAKIDRQERERAAEDSRISNAATDKFLTAKDDKGQPLYPFVDNVLDDMSARVGSIRGQNPSMSHEEVLKQAYDAAVWANPETRAVLIGQQQATANQPVETLRKVEQAKRASAVNVPKRGAIPARAPDTVLRIGTPESDESIRQTYRELTG